MLICASGRRARASSSAFWSGGVGLEAGFFIGSPFVCGGLAGADDAAGWFGGFGGWFGPGVDDERDDRADEREGLPAVAVWVRVGAAEGEGVVEGALCGGEAEAVVALVGSVLFGSPCPSHGGSSVM